MSVNVDKTGNSSAQSGVGATYVFPTTFAQQRLWFIEQLQPGSTAYLVPWSLRISGNLNIAALEQSLNEIIRRHEVLRTSFSWKDEQPVQVVTTSFSISLEPVELSSADPEQEAHQLAREEAHRPLDIEKGPLVRARLLRIRPDEHVLLLTMHHIIFDGWSRRILVRELAALYQAFCAGQPSPLPPPKLQYPDYAVWQRKHLQGANLEKQLSYWRGQLSGAPATLDLPTDRPRPAIQTFEGAKVPVAFPADLTRKLNTISREQGATLFMTLLAGFQILLSRYSNQDDIVVGSPIANRNRAEIEEMIGFFANTLALRTKLSPDATFKDVVAQVKETALGAYAHQDLPFEKLVEDLRPDRNLSQNPLFQVLFSLQNAPRQGFELGDLKLSLIDTGEASAKFDISLFLSESVDGIRGRAEYNTTLFDAATMERMVAHYQTLLESAVAHPEVAISKLPLLTEAERRQILVDWNHTEFEYPRNLCVHELFEQQAARTPDAVALIFNDQQLTYRELNMRANQIAHWLIKRGIGPGQRVGLYIERSLDMMTALLGIQKSGAAYVPLDPAYPGERIRLTIEDANAAVVLTQRALASLLPDAQSQVLCIDEESATISQGSTANPATAVQPEDLVYVIFTSGSTGRPKGVQVPHRAVVNLLTFMAQELKMGPQDAIPALASFAFDMCIPELYLALVTGGRVILGNKHLAADGEELAALLKRHRATFVHATPTTWNLLLQSGFTGQGLKRVIGAEPLPQELCARLLASAPSLYNFYGPTETTVWSTFHHFQSSDEPVVVGRPIGNTQVYILDRRMCPTPIGVAGEIHIGGDGVSRGYLNRPDLTAEKFIADPFSRKPGAMLYKTGDLGRYLRDGRIEFAGRADHQVKIRGYRIELGEIEAVLGKHPSVRECAVVAREDAPGDKRLVAYVVPLADSVNASELRTWVKSRLPEYMVPVAIVELAKFPLSPNGKVDRKSLPAPEYVRPETGEQYQAPNTPAEEMVAAIWAEVLKVERVGVRDNFFELGGHSLLATQAVSRIRQAFQIELPLRALFETPTVSGLATECEALQRSSKGLHAPPLKTVSRTEPLSLSFAQLRLWFLDKLEPNNPLYNVPHVMRLTGKLNVDALDRALNHIVSRHESLRTTFRSVSGSPMQVIAPSLTVRMHQTDLRELPESAREAEARRLAAAEVARPFDLETGPLIRGSLFQLAANDYVFVVSTHHIISDRWSLGVLAAELAAFYEQENGGAPAQIPPLALQYADYAAWQREYLADEVLERQLGYWKENLAGAPASLDLPTDRPRPAEQSFRGAKHTLTVPGELTEATKALGRKEGATLFMTLLATFDVLLARYSGQEDVVVGSPIAGRTRPEFENLIGLFINTLVFRTQLSADFSFRDLVRQVRNTAMGAYAHQDLPFEKLVRELKPERDLSRNPIFQVMFILQNAPDSGHETGGLQLRAFPLPGESSKFDLTLIAAESSEGLRLTAEYNSDLFDRSTIERMMGHYRLLLAAAVKKPECRISELPLLSPAESQQLIGEWNATHTEYPRDLCAHELFERQVKQTPDAIAITVEDESISYRELEARSNQMAAMLRNQGVGPDITVGVFLERSITMVAALLAVMKAGGAYIPLDPAYPPERIQFILEDAQVSVLLTQSSLRPFLPKISAPAIDIDGGVIELRPPVEHVPVSQVRPENLAYILYTSGSTGRPKGVQITHGNLVNFLLSMQKEPGLGGEDRLLAVTTLSFDIAGLELYLPLISGAQIILASRNQAADGRLLQELMRKSKVSVMQATPATWRMLIEAGWPGTPQLKILCGGEALPADLAAQLLPRCAQLWNMYGPTETTIWSSVHLVRTATATAPIGRPIANTTFYVLDSRLQPVPIGVSGELYIGGEGVARGYFRRPELTAEKFIADPFSTRPGARLYRTGDLARYLPDGNVQYLGRTDFQVKVRGFRIELGEIESALATHPAVQQAVVAARESSTGDKRLICYLVPQPGAHLYLPEIRAHLKQTLPDYMIPSAVVELAALPLTPNGKVDRKSLPAPEFQSVSGATVPPRDQLETELFEIWRGILKVDRFGVTDNFFDLGGHSLMAVRLMSEIKTLTGVEIPLTALFQGATIEHLAGIVRGTTDISRAVIQPIQTAGTRPPFFAAVLAGVNALGYVPLSKHLGANQPFYTLQTPGVGPRVQKRPYSQQEYEQVAGEYIRAMQTVQPHGPYHIGGTCEGARIAFEMARILEAQGEAVNLLAIIDTWVLENTQNRRLWKIYYHGERLRQIWRQPWRSQLAVARRILSNRISRWFGAKQAPAKSEWIEVYWPGEDFVPSHIQSRITVYKIPRQPFYYHADPLLGWGPRTSSGVDTHVIPHGRHRLLLREPYVQELAAALSRTLDQIQVQGIGNSLQVRVFESHEVAAASR